MKTFHRPADLVRHQMARFEKMKLDRNSAHREMVKGGVSDHNAYTKGTVSTEMLKEAGHPFGRKGAGARGIKASVRKKMAGKGSFKAWQTDKKGNWSRKSTPQISAKGIIKPLPINRQTGDLRRSLRVSGPAGSQQVYRVGFTEKYAGFVLSPRGTKRMVARGFYSQGNSMAGMGIIARNHKARQSALVRTLRNRNRN